MYASDPTIAQSTPVPAPAGAPFVVGAGFDADVTQAMVLPLLPVAPVAAAAHASRRGRRALVAIGLLGALAAGAFGARAVGDAGSVATTAASNGRIGSDLAGALPGEAALAEAGPDVEVTETTGAPAPTPAPGPAPQAPTPAPTTPTTSEPAPPSTPAPVVTDVSGPSSVVCSGGGTPYITISWVVEDADAVVLSIDGPGAYKNYVGANGSDSVPFPCDGDPHSYTVTAKLGGQVSAGTTVVVSPLTIQLPESQLVQVPELPEI